MSANHRTTRRNRRRAKAQAAVDAWNLAHPVGTPVTVVRDDGSRLATTTRAAAAMIGGSPVIWVHEIAGCYLLERVAPRKPN